jgi:hypothetical protein
LRSTQKNLFVIDAVNGMKMPLVEAPHLLLQLLPLQLTHFPD